MTQQPPSDGPEAWDRALRALVARGTITDAQRTAVLAELTAQAADFPTEAPAGFPTEAPAGFSTEPADAPAGFAPGAPAGFHAGSAPRSRSWVERLVEVGAYLGAALVLAALYALLAQVWHDLTQVGQSGILLGIAAVTAATGWWTARGADAGSPRRRLASVLLTGTAVSAGSSLLAILRTDQGTDDWMRVLSLTLALAILVLAQRLAASALTELALFVVAAALLLTSAEWLRPPGTVRLDENGYQYTDTSAYDAAIQVGGVAFGMLWAGIVARRLTQRDLGVAMGAGFAWVYAVGLASSEDSRPIGLVALALLGALGLWRFLAERRWPWLALAILSVTGFVFWLVGVHQSPALAFLVTGLVLLGSSAVGWRIGRRGPRAVPGDPS